MRIPEEITDWLRTNHLGDITSTHPVGGGCINNGLRLKTDLGETFFLKTNSDAPFDMFSREAEGLIHLSKKGGPRIPTPYFWGESFLLLEDLKPAQQKAGYWCELGFQLAHLHANVSRNFGFDHDNYIGSTPQPNPLCEDGYRFFGEHRLYYQAKLAFQRQLLSYKDLQRVESVIDRLPNLVPIQPASLIHGDLWSGNVITGPSGEPAIIDPAAHYGWAEAELAMTALFGGFQDDFYRSYLERRPLETGWQERFDLYNLYHLMNHLNIFGYGYRSQVLSIIGRYS